MSSRPKPRPFLPAYVTRKRLTTNELLTAAGVGIGLGLTVFYFAKIWLERTPVLPPAPNDEETLRSTVTPRRAST